MNTRQMKNLPILLLALPLLLAAGAADAQKLKEITVTGAVPAEAEQGVIELDVEITGSGFDSTVEAVFLLSTNNDDTGGVVVLSNRYSNPRKMTARISVSDSASIGDYDILVRSSSGRRGKGNTLFRVLEKGTGGESSYLARGDFMSQGTTGTPGIFGIGQGFYCASDDRVFDYVDNQDDPSDCAPDPGAQTGSNFSDVSAGGRWHLYVTEGAGPNPNAVRFDFSGYTDPTDCVRLNEELAVMGLDCGCADAELTSACDLHIWLSADNIFKDNDDRLVIGRFDIYEVGGSDGQDGVDLRIEYHEAPWICEAAGHEGDPNWRVIQTAPCGSANLETGALADVIYPPSPGGGQYEVLGQWSLPFQITGHQVPLPPPPTSNCTDADGDGVCVEDGDCDDGNADVYPGHSDRGKKWGQDGIDNDCDGTPDR